jgi:hypothetical protein
MDYRLYSLDAKGRIFSVLEMECDDNDLAIQRAEGHVDGHVMELWQQATFIRSFRPKDRPAVDRQAKLEGPPVAGKTHLR